MKATLDKDNTESYNSSTLEKSDWQELTGKLTSSIKRYKNVDNTGSRTRITTTAHDCINAICNLINAIISNNALTISCNEGGSSNIPWLMAITTAAERLAEQFAQDQASTCHELLHRITNKQAILLKNYINTQLVESKSIRTHTSTALSTSITAENSAQEPTKNNVTKNSPILCSDSSITYNQQRLQPEYTRTILSDSQLEIKSNHSDVSANNNSLALKLSFHSIRMQLRKYRIEFMRATQQQFLNTLPAQAQYTKQIQTIIGILAQRAEDLLSDAPCNYAILSMGSMARQELCLYSDLEFAIAYETKSITNRHYFRAFAQAMESQFIGLGESADALINSKNDTPVSLIVKLANGELATWNIPACNFDISYPIILEQYQLDCDNWKKRSKSNKINQFVLLIFNPTENNWQLFSRENNKLVTTTIPPNSDIAIKLKQLEDELKQKNINKQCELIQRKKNYYLGLLLNSPLFDEHHLFNDSILWRPLPKGFSFDDGQNVPTRKESLLGTPSELISLNFKLNNNPNKLFASESITISSLKEAQLAWGNAELGNQFRLLLKECLDKPLPITQYTQRYHIAYTLLKDHCKEFIVSFDKKQDNINIKRHLLRLPIFTLNCLCLGFGISADSTLAKLEQLKKLGHFTLPMARALEITIQLGFHWRNRLHTFYRTECDIAYLNKEFTQNKSEGLDNRQFFRFSVEQKNLFISLQMHIVQPIGNIISEFVKQWQSPKVKKHAFHTHVPPHLAPVYMSIAKFAEKSAHYQLAVDYYEQAKQLAESQRAEVRNRIERQSSERETKTKSSILSKRKSKKSPKTSSCDYEETIKKSTNNSQMSGIFHSRLKEVIVDLQSIDIAIKITKQRQQVQTHIIDLCKNILSKTYNISDNVVSGKPIRTEVARSTEINRLNWIASPSYDLPPESIFRQLLNHAIANKADQIKIYKKTLYRALSKAESLNEIFNKTKQSKDNASEYPVCNQKIIRMSLTLPNQTEYKTRARTSSQVIDFTKNYMRDSSLTQFAQENEKSQTKPSLDEGIEPDSISMAWLDCIVLHALFKFDENNARYLLHQVYCDLPTWQLRRHFAYTIDRWSPENLQVPLSPSNQWINRYKLLKKWYAQWPNVSNRPLVNCNSSEIINTLFEITEAYDKSQENRYLYDQNILLEWLLPCNPHNQILDTNQKNITPAMASPKISTTSSKNFVSQQTTSISLLEDMENKDTENQVTIIKRVLKPEFYHCFFNENKKLKLEQLINSSINSWIPIATSQNEKPILSAKLYRNPPRMHLAVEKLIQTISGLSSQSMLIKLLIPAKKIRIEQSRKDALRQHAAIAKLPNQIQEIEIDLRTKNVHDKYKIVESLPESTLNQSSNTNYESYPLLLSNSLHGVRISDSKKQKPDALQFKKNIDKRIFTLKIIETLIIQPTNFGPDNLIFTPLSYANDSYGLIRLNHAPCFIKPLTDGHRSGYTNRKSLVMHSKNYLMCLDQMALQPDILAIKEFLLLDPYEAIKTWLARLQSSEHVLFKANGLFKSNRNLENCSEKWLVNSIENAFKKNDISGIYQRWTKLQSVLLKNIPDNHFLLIEAISPNLLSFYQYVHNIANKALERFVKLPKESISINKIQNRFFLELWCRNFKKPKNSQNIKLSEGLKELEIQHKNNNDYMNAKNEIEKNNCFLLERSLIKKDFKQDVINNLQWSSLSSDTQKSIFKIITGMSFTVLCLIECDSLTSEILKTILQASPNLSYLQIEKNTKIDSKIGKYIFEKNSKIKTLILRNIPHIKKIFMTNLKEKESPYKNLEIIIIEDCQFTNQGAYELTKHLSEMRALLQLSLKNNLIDEKGIISIVKEISQVASTRLISCNFSRNLIKTLYIKKILSLQDDQSSYSSVTHIDLTNTKPKANIIIAILSLFPLLQSFDISNNKFSNKQLKKLIKQLINNRFLTNLNLSENSITDSIIRDVAPVLKSLSSLTQINLSQNCICNEGADILVEFINTCSTLININLSDNSILPNVVIQIERTLKERRECLLQKQNINTLSQLQQTSTENSNIIIANAAKSQPASAMLTKNCTTLFFTSDNDEKNNFESKRQITDGIFQNKISL